MNRKNKIEMLNDIKAGKLNMAELEEPRIFVIDQVDDDPITYEYDGKKYSQQEYEQLCGRIKARNIEKDRIVTFTWDERYGPMKSYR